MESWKLDRIGSCERGENPTLICKMRSGYAVMGDHQFLPGYCLLLGYPQVSSLNELPIAARNQYLLDTTLIGDAIISVCKPLRVNYSTLMNLDHYLHTHIEARYGHEPEFYKTKPTWYYPHEQRFGDEYHFCNKKYGELKCKIEAEIIRLMKEVY